MRVCYWHWHGWLIFISSPLSHLGKRKFCEINNEASGQTQQEPEQFVSVSWWLIVALFHVITVSSITEKLKTIFYLDEFYKQWKNLGIILAETVKRGNSKNSLENSLIALNTMAWQRHSGNEQSRTIYFFHSFCELFT